MTVAKVPAHQTAPATLWNPPYPPSTQSPLLCLSFAEPLPCLGAHPTGVPNTTRKRSTCSPTPAPTAWCSQRCNKLHAHADEPPITFSPSTGTSQPYLPTPTPTHTERLLNAFAMHGGCLQLGTPSCSCSCSAACHHGGGCHFLIVSVVGRAVRGAVRAQRRQRLCCC